MGRRIGVEAASEPCKESKKIKCEDREQQCDNRERKGRKGEGELAVPY